jgi:pyruvate dehydrogenase E1 component alpha subunit
VNDPGKYMPAERLAYYKARDPVDRARKCLMEMGAATEAEIAAIEQAAADEFEHAVNLAKNAGEVTPDEFRAFIAEY